MSEQPAAYTVEGAVPALLPCPFCGGRDAFVEREDYSSAYVQCASLVDEHSCCYARGPIAIQDDDGEEIPGAAAAIAAWNRRAGADVQGEPARHDWDEQDKCRRCGDRDWYAGPICTPKQPAEQQPFEWPRLDRPAKVGAVRCGKGVSSRLVIEAAQRQYEYDVTPEKEVERIAKFADFRKEVLQPVLAAAGLVEALEKIADLQIDPCSTENDYRLSAAKSIASAALDARRKGGGA